LSHVLAMETMGIEPIQTACKAASPPWHMRPRENKGPADKTSEVSEDFGSLGSLGRQLKGPAGSRTRTATVPRWCAAVTPQDRSGGGRIRTGVGRLMRPCWEPGSSPLRSQYPRQDSNLS